MELERRIVETDGEHLVCEFKLREKNAVIIHGAGTSGRHRYHPIAEELWRQGLGVVLFDLSGHGDSSGALKDSSLARRRRQAEAVIDALVPTGDLYLVGFSMGAQTVCDVLPKYGSRTKAVLLGCPAIYAADVHDVRFGDPAFTERLREHESWATSDAPKLLSNFNSRTVIAIGSEDEVIPEGVVELLKEAAKDLEFRRYDGATHALAAWLAEHSAELKELAALLIG